MNFSCAAFQIKICYFYDSWIKIYSQFNCGQQETVLPCITNGKKCEYIIKGSLQYCDFLEKQPDWYSCQWQTLFISFNKLLVVGSGPVLQNIGLCQTRFLVIKTETLRPPSHLQFTNQMVSNQADVFHVLVAKHFVCWSRATKTLSSYVKNHSSNLEEHKHESNSSSQVDGGNG